MSQVSSTKKLVSASALMASGTMISRVLGVIRVAMLGFILGAGTRQVDMFELANSVPNSIYILFAGGALNTVLVPQIVRAIKNDPDGGEAYTNRIMTAFMMIVTGVSVIVTIAAPVIIWTYSGQGWRAPELASQYSSMVALAYLTLPQIFFYGAFFLLGQVLNARDKFGPMMWAPIANNVVSIAVLGLYLVIWGSGQDHSAAFTNGQIWLLGAGSTLGIAIQTMVLIPYVRRIGFRFRPRFDLKGTGLGKTFKLAGWTMGFVAANQVALVVVQKLATGATATGHGAGLYAYNQAHLLWILPHSLITVSLATAMLPNASRLAASGDKAGVAAEFTKTTRLSLLIIVPASVVFLALAEPVSGLLFGHGSAAQDSHFIAWALMGFAIGLIPFTIQFVCLRTYYALEDTRTPFLLQLLIAGINIIGALVLVYVVANPSLVAACLGLAYSLAYLVGVFVSWKQLRKRIPELHGGPLMLHLVRLLIGSLIGGVAGYFLAGWITGVLGHGFLGNLVAAGAGGTLVLASFLLVGKLLKVRELSSLSELLRSRLGRGKTSPASVTAPDLADDQATVMLPAINDWDDIGPVTIVRNRPPITQHTFDVPETPASPVEAAFHRPSSLESTALTDMSDIFSPSSPADDEATEDALGDGSDAGYAPGDHSDDLPTGPIALPNVFRDEPRRVHPSHIATHGTLINTRYELLELLAQRHGTESWRAHDQVLSRDVVVHVVAPGDARISDLLTAARKGAVATDSRFLRVLDADEITDPTLSIGAYVVTEYAHGRSLTDLLTKGTLSGLEAAFIVRELADALVGVHAQGLFHEQLNPDNVIITSSGAVRLVGFGIEATLARDTLANNAWAMREHQDVTGLGSLLYACLVRRWPGGAAFGLAEATVLGGQLAAPRVIASGISPALDRICVVTLTQRGDATERRITTAAQLAAALNHVLGTADASADLEQRVRTWDAQGDAPVPLTQPTGVPVPAPRINVPHRHDSPEPIVARSDTGRSRRVLWALIVLAVLALVVSLVMVGINSARDNAGASTSQSAPQSSASGADPNGTPITIVSARDFDPESDGGNGEELPDQVSNVFDNDPSTSWQTMPYKNRPNLGGLKPGVGVVLDLGETHTVSAAHLTLTGGATSVEIRVPQGSDASMRSVEDWKVVGANDAADGTVTIGLTQPTETRYVLVYLTSLPQVGDRYIGQIDEVSLT